uniref:Prostaglandin E synthase 3 n=1 Tax=Jaculus jaculus TaxID=51337 RepID=A0A8C5KNZ1_JACJA
MKPASAKDYVFIEFCVEDSKHVNVNSESSKLTFSCLGRSDNFKHLNEIDLFDCTSPNDSKYKRTGRSILCCLQKRESGQSWPRLTKERMMDHMGGKEVDFPEVDGADDDSQDSDDEKMPDLEYGLCHLDFEKEK